MFIRKPLSLGIILSSSVIAVACGGSSADAPPVAPVSAEYTDEGSDAPVTLCDDEGAGSSASDALALGLSGIEGCLGAEPDVFEVRAPNHAAGTLYTFELGRETGAVTAELLDSAEAVLASQSLSDGGTTAMWAVVASKSKVYLRLSGSSVDGAYQLSVNATPLSDDSEPNDTREQAQPLNMDRVMDALLQTAANGGEHLGRDYYQLLVSRRGNVSVSVEPRSDELTLDVELQSSDGDRIEGSQAANAGAPVTVTARVQRGTYYVRVGEDSDAPQRAAGVGEPPSYLTQPYTIEARTR